MGFTRDESTNALRTAKGNIEAALDVRRAALDRLPAPANVAVVFVAILVVDGWRRW